MPALARRLSQWSFYNTPTVNVMIDSERVSVGGKGTLHIKDNLT